MVVAAGEDTQARRLKAQRANVEAKNSNEKKNEKETENVGYPSLW